MSLTKADIVYRVYEDLGVSLTDSVEIVETLLELMKECLESGDDLLISGFGKFQVRSKRRRRGRNPQTGEDVVISPRKVMTFKPSNILRRQMNSGHST